MKRFSALFILAFGLLAAWNPAYGQRFSYLDTQYILDQMPEYKAVQQELEDLSSQWQQEIEQKQAAIEKKFEDFQARRPLLSQEEQNKIQDEIEQMERDLAEYRAEKFGYDGELYTLREEKMKPIQDRLLQAINDVAKAKRSDAVFDRASSGAVLVYTNEAYDISNDVLKKLGITPSASGPADPSLRNNEQGGQGNR